MKINQGAEDTVILLRQSSCISFRISNQFKLFDIGFEGFIVDRLKLSVLLVCLTVRLWLNGILKSSSTEKWSEIKSEVETERSLHPVEQIIG